MITKIMTCLLGLGIMNTAIGADKLDSLDDTSDWNSRMGIRFGYNYANGAETSDRLDSPHMFSMGFEMQQTRSGGSWLDVLFIQNATISGLDQSVVAPSFSLLVGFEINKQVQLGVGPNLTFYDPSGEDNYFHLITAAGYTAEAGIFSVPLHLFYVPDVNDHYRIGLTTGVNW